MGPLVFLALGAAPALILIRRPELHEVRAKFLDYARAELITKSPARKSRKALPQEVADISTAIKNLRKSSKTGWGAGDLSALKLVFGALASAKVQTGMEAVDSALQGFLKKMEDGLKDLERAVT